MFTELQKYLPQKMFLLEGNEDVYSALIVSVPTKIRLHTGSFPRFTIEHALTLVREMREGDGIERAFIFYIAIYTPDAAQVLLKSLEEPDVFTTVIFVTDRPQLFPLTIRSRLQLIKNNQPSRNESTIPIPNNRTEALAFIKSVFDSDEDEAATLRAKAITFLDALEVHTQKDLKKAQYVYEAKSLLFDSNLPTKQVLEYVITMVL